MNAMTEETFVDRNFSGFAVFDPLRTPFKSYHPQS